MFQRRTPLSRWEKIASFFWPKAGWVRASTYLWHRLRRLPGSSYAIAAGFASGAAVSFLPLSGLHFLLGALLAWVIRGNILASALGTVVGNPWTFPLIWIGSYRLGGWILAGIYDQVPTATPRFAAVFDTLWQGVMEGNISQALNSVLPIWWPMMVGGTVMAILAWVGFYWLLRRAIDGYERRRALRQKEGL